MTTSEAQTIMELFSMRLQLLLDRNQITQAELSNILGVSPSTVNKWLFKKSVPRMGVIEKLSAYFGVPKSYFLENDADMEKQRYYLNPETAELAQMLHDNPQYKVMFDATRDLDPESVKKIIDFINYQRHLEGYED